MNPDEEFAAHAKAFKAHDLNLRPEKPHGRYLIIPTPIPGEFARIPRMRLYHDSPFQTDEDLAITIARLHGPGRVWLVDNNERRLIYYHEHARETA